MNDDDAPEAGGWVMRHDMDLLEERDLSSALWLLDALAERGAKVDAAVALTVALRCLETAPPPRPKRPRGRPPLTFEEQILRIVDGKAAIEGKSLSRTRSQRDIEYCMAEYRDWIKSEPQENPKK